MRNVLILSIVFLFSCKSESFLAISKKIYEQQSDETSKVKKYTFHQVRKKLLESDQRKFLRQKFDSMFFLEKFSNESNKYYGKIWTKFGSVSYFFSRDTLSFSNEDFFTPYMISLIRKWDTASMHKEEEMYSDLMPQHSIYGSLVVIDSGNYAIRTIKFKNFFKPDRDR